MFYDKIEFFKNHKIFFKYRKHNIILKYYVIFSINNIIFLHLAKNYIFFQKLQLYQKILLCSFVIRKKILKFRNFNEI